MRMEYQGTRPERTRDGDSAYDLRANLERAVWLASGQREVIPLGTRLAIPDGLVGLVVPRSGLAARHGITIVNTPGVIDANYRGEIMAILHNTSDKPFKVEPGDRVAQLLIVKVELPEFIESDDLGWTNRGANGFGSSGVK